jgi:hypothetical protein
MQFFDRQLLDGANGISFGSATLRSGSYLLIPFSINPLHRRSQHLQRGVVLSKIPDFHGQFKKKILVSGQFQRFFSKGGPRS